MDDGTTSSEISQTATQANVLVTNGAGNTHGLTVGTSGTTLSGGTSSTTQTLDDNGVRFTNDDTGNNFLDVNSGGAGSTAVVATLGSATADGNLNLTNGAGGTGVALDGGTGDVDATE